MSDPLAEIITLLQPGARFSKLVFGAGAWLVARSEFGEPFYCVVLEGECRIALKRGDSVDLRAGDFVLVPAAHDFVMSSLDALPELDESVPVKVGSNRFRVGKQHSAVNVRILVGSCHFGSSDAALLVSLLPRFIHIRDERRLASLVTLVDDEARAERPARDVVLSRLLEVLFIEALRFHAESDASLGLVRGLADPRIAQVIRAMHEQPERQWTVAKMADQAALSRSAFFGRFKQTVGITPMTYLQTWRMALAKCMLREKGSCVARVAEKTGYGSASAFSVAFTRSVGQSPGHYARKVDQVA